MVGRQVHQHPLRAIFASLFLPNKGRAKTFMTFFQSAIAAFNGNILHLMRTHLLDISWPCFSLTDKDSPNWILMIIFFPFGECKNLISLKGSTCEQWRYFITCKLKWNLNWKRDEKIQILIRWLSTLFRFQENLLQIWCPKRRLQICNRMRRSTSAYSVSLNTKTKLFGKNSLAAHSQQPILGLQLLQKIFAKNVWLAAHLCWWAAHFQERDKLLKKIFVKIDWPAAHCVE